MAWQAGLALPCIISLMVLSSHLHGQHLEAENERSPWIHASEYRYKAALKEFRTLQSESTGSERQRARFGEALMLLNVQPRTVDKIERAREIFLDIAYQDPTDELSIRSIFYLGRINQVHQSAWDWDRASLYYEELFRRWPEHPFSQMGLAKYAMIQLYQPNPRDEREERLRELEKLAEVLTYPPAVRDFNYVVGVACLSMELSKEVALQHLIVVANSELHQSRSLASIYVRIGETARQLGKYELAEKYYRIFLERFPRELRTTIIRDRIAEIQAKNQ